LQVPGAPPSRERPQDAEPEPRPWTARSYVAGAPLAPPSGTDLPKTPAVPAPVNEPTGPPAPPEFKPPQSFLKPAIPPPAKVQPKKSSFAKRALVTAVGLILALAVVAMVVSRQNLRASQNKAHAVTAVTEPVEPIVKPSSPAAPAAPEARAPKHEEPAPEEVVNPEVSAKQILNGPVRTLWESGRYAQALALVNQVLAKDSNDEDARSWKKKIREAQAAEAALK